jgi:hypothetical protein
VSLSRLQDESARLSLHKSEIVREAIIEYLDRSGRLSERERVALLNTFNALVPQIPLRSEREADNEIAAIRCARRGGAVQPILRANRDCARHVIPD